MNNKRNYSLNIVPKMLRDSASQLEAQIRELESSEGSPTEDNYNEILYITRRVITAAIQMTEALEAIAEDANLQAPDSVIGPALKENLSYSYTEKNKVARIALVGASGILNSHNELVGYSVAKVADTCHEFMEEDE